MKFIMLLIIAAVALSYSTTTLANCKGKGIDACTNILIPGKGDGGCGGYYQGTGNGKIQCKNDSGAAAGAGNYCGNGGGC